MANRKSQLDKAIDQSAKKRITFLIIFLVISVLAVVWLWFLKNNNFSFNDNLTDNQAAIANSAYNLQKIKSELIVKLKNLAENGKYGDWPITEVPLSARRGNPFLRKR